MQITEQQQAEIERLNADIEKMQDRNFKLFDLIFTFRRKVETAKSEAIKEFAEELKTRIKNAVFCCYDIRFKPHLQELLKIIVAKIDNLVKEMEDKNG